MIVYIIGFNILSEKKSKIYIENFVNYEDIFNSSIVDFLLDVANKYIDL